jgi:hypothetical protein
MPPVKFPDETEVVRAHDFGDDHVRAQTLDGPKGLGHAARRAADLKTGTTVDPAGFRAPSENMPIHQKNPSAPAGRINPQILSPLQIKPALSAFPGLHCREDCIVNTHANCSAPALVSTIG